MNVDYFIQDKTLIYFMAGFVGAVAMTWFIAVNEYLENVESKYKIVRFNRLRTALFIVVQTFVNGLVGGLSSIVTNHNIGIAIVIGAFSQFIVLTLVKWARTRNFRIAIGEIAGAYLKTFAVTSSKKKNKGNDQDSE